MSTDHTNTITEPAQPAPEQAVPTIGVFDSGIGGFTVAGAILNRRPDVNLVYFGDTLNMPYGGRSLEQLARFARNSIEFLLAQGMDILAVGCNASNSALGQGELKSFGVPAYDLVSSTVEHLRSITAPPAKLGLVATQAAIRSGYWERKLIEVLPETQIIPVAAPEFVPLIEAAQQSDRANLAAVEKHLKPLVDDGVTVIVHGCTHYPLLQPYMEQLFPDLAYLDPAVCLAEKLVGSIAPPRTAAPRGAIRLFSSLPSSAFYGTAERVFGRPARNLTKMYIVNPHED
ncbi:glutamate racemase [bacterium]|nr:glutamate racemase [bacterium]